MLQENRVGDNLRGAWASIGFQVFAAKCVGLENDRASQWNPPSSDEDEGAGASVVSETRQMSAFHSQGMVKDADEVNSTKGNLLPTGDVFCGDIETGRLSDVNTNVKGANQAAVAWEGLF
jgi:hypothetical protein